MAPGVPESKSESGSLTPHFIGVAKSPHILGVFIAYQNEEPRLKDREISLKGRECNPSGPLTEATGFTGCGRFPQRTRSTISHTSKYFRHLFVILTSPEIRLVWMSWKINR
jgi:hypothetical protein